MAYDIILGRSPSDKEHFGSKGTIFLGKGYVTMGQTTSLSNRILLDIVRSHVILVSGKRGGGKSYSLSVIAEEMAAQPDEISRNLAMILIGLSLEVDSEKVEVDFGEYQDKIFKLVKKLLASQKKLIIEIEKEKMVADLKHLYKLQELDSFGWYELEEWIDHRIAFLTSKKEGK